MKKLILSTIAGGLIFYIWSMISWMVLPWHNTTIHKFNNESLVQTTLSDHVGSPGIYMLPNNMRSDAAGVEAQDPEAAIEASKKLYDKGPLAFVAYRPGGAGSMGAMMAKGIVNQLLAAFLISFTLVKMKGNHIGCRMGTVMVMALFAGIACHGPYWNWWGFPTLYTVISILDLLIGWFLAGLVMSRLTIQREEASA